MEVGSRAIVGGHDVTVVGRAEASAQEVPKELAQAEGGSSVSAAAQGDALARDGGLNPVDAGGQARARELEALGLLHMSIQGALGSGFGSAVKVVS